MRLIRPLLILFCCALLPAVALAAGGGWSVRAIAFVASNERGPSDPRLASYEGVLRSNLRFESFRYVAETSKPVRPGAATTFSVAGIGRIEARADQGGVSVRHNGTTVLVSPGRPAVFLGGPAGKGHTSGVIVMVD